MGPAALESFNVPGHHQPRGEDFQSINTAGLYPGGEGAGYAEGILSAAVDGIKLAEALARRVVG